MRHWRHALEQIYEHRATKAVPGYGPQTDTEKALVEALKQLELQCKERIDLLEALRVSRQVGKDLPPASNMSSMALTEPANTSNRAKGSIGQGSIPAVTYSELSRPTLPSRPSLPTRTSSEYATVSTASTSSHYVGMDSNIISKPRSQSPNPPPRPDKTLRSPSPEKHTMRTTLRSNRVGEQPSKPTRRSPKPVAEGPSKAATVAWSALGSRERLLKVPSSDMGTTNSQPAARRSSDQYRPLPSSLQWDSHSRRLVTSRESETVSNGSPSAASTRHSDEMLHSRSPLLSITAASSALTSSSQPETNPTDQFSGRPDRGAATQASTTLMSKNARDQQHARGASPTEDSGEFSDRRGTSDAPARRKAVSKRPQQTAQVPSKTDSSLANSRRLEVRRKQHQVESSESGDNATAVSGRVRRVKRNESALKADGQSQSSEDSPAEESSSDLAWKKKKASILKNLPPGVDESAAKQILNDIVIQGDEVRWGDIAGLEIAKNALRETVVYPFLRPDLFMGLREPARGMLLFGPPGTGKTMLARAVATESKSTFFSISASSLTSKYLGESEKLVRALFGLARALAPSIIFVDEIDSLLSQRSGSGEHEATRRIKTEFLIQWSDLQRAAAGRETSERDKERGDANRVLVLAATNLPWAIDEAARRRFVRRQYIPLPEPTTRETQIRTLLGQQKHNLSTADIHRLVELTDGT